MGSRLASVLIAMAFGISPLVAQDMIKCGQHCKSSCNVVGMCSTPECEGDQYLPGRCECEIKTRCGIFGCFNLCTTGGNMCELGCDQGVPSPTSLPGVDWLGSGPDLPEMSAEAAESVHQYPGIAELIQVAGELKPGPHTIMLSRRIDGVEIEPGILAYARPNRFFADVETDGEAKRFEVSSEQNQILLQGLVHQDGRTQVVLFSGLTGNDQPETIVW